MDFGDVIRGLKENPERRFTREGWNGKGQWISLQVPKTGSDMTQPYIYIHTNYDANVPWLASQTDMLAEDWEEFRDRGRSDEGYHILNDGAVVRLVIQRWDSNDRGYSVW